jgi:hypothetical protein
VDYWEQDVADSFRPTIGILTMPMNAGFENESTSEDFILETNDSFI